MKYYGKSKEVCDEIINIFQSGDLPSKLAPIFINRKDNIPSSRWSWMNRMMMVINGTHDARTFKQWGNVGRKIKKGSKSFIILGPCLKNIPKEDDDGNPITIKILYGFKGINVFKFEDTEVYDQELWDKNSGIDKEAEEHLHNLPLREVAEKWDLEISSYNGKNARMLGYYRHGKQIAIGVENLSVFFHELVHAAEYKLDNLNKTVGQDKENEIVAEFGGNVLLKIMGFEKDIDLGGAWEYIKAYAGNDDKKTIKLIGKLIDRICESVNLILEEGNVIINEIEEAA